MPCHATARRLLLVGRTRRRERVFLRRNDDAGTAILASLTVGQSVASKASRGSPRRDAKYNAFADIKDGNHQNDDGSAFFWDPPSAKNRDAKKDNQTRLLQEQLSQATVKIRELEAELKTVRRVNAQSSKEDVLDCHQKTELLRAKQDMINRIIQMGEKNREAERNMKRLQLDEAVLVNDFRGIMSQLGSTEQLDLIRAALKSLEIENEKEILTGREEKFDVNEKIMKYDDGQFESVCLKTDNDNGTAKREDKLNGDTSNKETDLLRRIAQLEEENVGLNTSIVELDQQHSESIERLLSIKEEMQNKHQTLQNAYEQLYAEYNNAQSKLETVKSKLQFAEANNNTIGAVSSTNIREVEELSRKVKEILRNEEIEEQDDRSIFETVAEKYVESKWKKDMLERRLTEVSRELKDVAEMKESVQLECDDMQLNIDSLLAEIEHLKSNLPSIPEASEERVASLETETESLQEEIDRLQSQNTATRQQNFDLVMAVHNIEATLRNQENLEAELRNTKQQLEIAQQQLSGASKNVENNENMLEDLSRRLHSSLDENNELRATIDEMKMAQANLEQRLEDQIESTKKLESELESLREDLKRSVSNEKRLEGEVKTLQDAKSRIQSDLETAFQEREELQTSFDPPNQVADLEYDLSNMRKELDVALSQAEIQQSEIEKLSHSNERLVRENSSLLDQLGATQDESLDNIELLNTEMVLLEQKYNALEKEIGVKTAELAEALEQLHVNEGKCVRLENELATCKLVTEKLQTENGRCIDLENESKVLKANLEHFKNIEGKFKDSEDQCRQLKIELESVKSEAENLVTVEKKCCELEAKLNDLRNVEAKLQLAESKCIQLETELRDIRSNQVAGATLEEVQRISDEMKDVREALAEKTRENDVLIAENAKHCRTEKSLVESNQDSAEMARETINGLTRLVREKDAEIQNLRSSVTGNPVDKHEEQLLAMKKERDELVNLVQVKHNESVQYHLEIQRLTQLVNEQLTNNQKLKVEHDRVSEAVKEKEAELLWAQNELQVVRQRLKNFEESNNYGENCGVVEHSVQLAQAGILNEKCNALEAALVQEQSSNRILQNQLVESQKKEAAAGKELDRLRTHLMEIEASYTEEALSAEQKQKELEVKLMQAEERVKNSSTVYTSASIRANQQVETLQQQMALIVQQRDEIQKKLSISEDKVLAHAASLTNLQIVLEQFQSDKDKDILSATEKIQQQLEESYERQAELSDEITNLKDQLIEAKECLQAASRLSEQLDKKTERIEELKQEVARLTELVSTADDRIQGANKSGEGKVDRALLKNLILGYVSSATGDKLSVLRVLATVLDFNESDREKSGLNSPAASGSWFAGLLRSGGVAQSKDQEASLSAAFVRFLESESKPKAQLPALPISTTPPPRPGHSRQHSSSSNQSTLLLSNITLPTFPDFVPARNTGSILKEVLKDS
ncbi:thyroid receptor-interacting protein 11 isoform X2 [Neodiprion pinetum]|uniref:thyroid receptor-interacting protein 11 isoform X2 n=1 Tax=Neodiprion pinetum TaxID=441929 RepID=UPI001EE07756|nr:thyroid receptor-interacting protein 11-like isoform X2 [Neodiprion pinetum]